MNLEFKVIDNRFITIKEVLRDYFNISERLLTKLKKSNKILLNGNIAIVNQKLQINDVISINLDFDEESENIVPTKMDLDIVFEDEALIIINKQPNMPVHPSILHFEDSLSNGLKFYFNSINLKRKLRPVNRLDKDTSGIVIFAKNEYVQEILIRQMKQNIFKKEYLAILEGHLETFQGTINAPISRKENSIIEREINSNGDNSITHYNVLNNFIHSSGKKLSLVKFILETGRTHQIRVHSKHINHPILGDSLYGNSSDIISRQALHAYRVTFLHPISKKELIIETTLPKDMITIIK